MGSVQRPPEAAPSTNSADRPPLHRCERSSPVKNRMREICTSGTVRGGGGNILTYSEVPAGRGKGGAVCLSRNNNTWPRVSCGWPDLNVEPEIAEAVGVPRHRSDFAADLGAEVSPCQFRTNTD